MLPSGSWIWPAQKASHGVGMFFTAPVAGLRMMVRNVPLLKNVWLLPDPAMISRPSLQPGTVLWNSVACMALIWYWPGMSSFTQSPVFASWASWWILMLCQKPPTSAPTAGTLAVARQMPAMMTMVIQNQCQNRLFFDPAGSEGADSSG